MKQEIDPLAERLVKSKGFRWPAGSGGLGDRIEKGEHRDRREEEL